ncbi:MAG: TusE/DsrC/DsvC family sulfur relay protein [Candidatus Abyssobacteria bacterium SURF_17]|jgi:tRNA 2-thiouridine synthesizing protein E|uniref:TusE/DsrC/DsvC family sulfur relay protein n=1 Tax=Candidatus Abyssobacteria bacterium SURF_17 TaxID=2093361 RepID=A0A419EYK8_9BACT|nr:MAG: TusE/DsrC/DsvC family sulfur relay protein [Candidatus Abyssubacteria bacterium SURF_17]
MPTISVSNTRINVDDEGYLIDFQSWNETVARALAEREGLGELTKDRMDILQFMRDYYKRFNSFPIVQAVCKNLHQSKDCTYEQFPDPLKAWKVAGLPKPTTEVFALLRHNL